MLKRLFQWAIARKADEGVTLIELLAVIVILAIIAGIAVPVVLGSINSAKVNTTEQDLSIISEALNRYAVEHNGQYPTTSSASAISLQGTALVAPSGDSVTYIPPNSTTPTTGTLEKALAPYLAAIPADGWGNAFGYSAQAPAPGSTQTFTVETMQSENSLYYYVTNSNGVTDSSTSP